MSLDIFRLSFFSISFSVLSFPALRSVRPAPVGIADQSSSSRADEAVRKWSQRR